MATYKKFTKNGNKVQVESAVRDGDGLKIDTNYAKQDGNYPTLSAGLADNLKTDLGTEQEYDYLSEQAILSSLDDDARASITNIKGNSFVYNQLLNPQQSSSTETINGITFTNNGDGSWTLSGLASANANKYIMNINKDKVSNHKILWGLYPTTLTGMYATEGYTGITASAYKITTLGALSNNFNFYIVVENGTDLSTSKTITPLLIDLTQMFPVDTPTTTDDPRVQWLIQYAQENSSYNTGALLNSKPTALISKSFNVFDEEMETGGISSSTGQNETSSSRIRSKNYIPVIPNTQYYLKGTNAFNYVMFYDYNKNYISYVGDKANSIITIPNNVYYLRFVNYTAYGTTYNNDICINISNATLNGTYRPYKAPISYPLSLPDMRSAGSVKDDTKKVNVGVTLDLSTLPVQITSIENLYYITINNFPNFKEGAMLCSDFIYNDSSNITGNSSANDNLSIGEFAYRHGTVDRIYFKTTSSTITGTLYYQLATPSDQPAITLPENIEFEKGGSLEVAYDSTAPTPADFDILYQLDLKGFVEEVGARTDINWDADEIVSHTELEAETADTVEKLERGEIIPANSQLSDNLTPYSEDSGAEQENPFISNGTGTNNNTEIVTVGDYGLFQEKQGNSIVVNQIVKNGTFDSDLTNWSIQSGSGQFSVVNSQLNVNIPSSGSSFLRNYQQLTCNTSHKYLLCATGYSTSTTYPCAVYFNSDNSSNYPTMVVNFHNTSSKTVRFRICEPTNSTMYIGVVCAKGSSDAMAYFDNIFLVDLTQMFNGDIPQDLLDNPSHFSWYYNGSLAYNTGSLDNANGVKLVSTGRNLWDEQWEISSSTFATNNIFCSKNLIPVTPNTQYCIINSIMSISSYGVYIAFYNSSGDKIRQDRLYSGESWNAKAKIFATISNCYFIKFGFSKDYYGNTYNHDITISLYYTPAQGGEGYDKYYPYETPYVVDTGSEVLRKAGSVKDIKVPSGLITRPVGGVDLGTLNWSKYSGTFYADVPTKIARGNGYNKISILCVKYTSIACNSNMGTENGDKVIWEYRQPTPSKRICINDSSISTAEDFATAMNGVYLYCELETPTTEQGTPFAENLPINDYGMLYWLDSSNNLVGIPQGAKIFYPTNYKGFVDDVYMRTNGDASDLVIQSELSASKTQRDTIDTQLKNAIGGTLRQCLCVKESLDFDNTNVVDMGSLNWAYSVGRLYSTSLVGIIKPTTNDSEIGHALCTKYSTKSYNDYLNNELAIGDNGYVYLKDSNYTDGDTFKNAMKGVLLAYEKA